MGIKYVLLGSVVRVEPQRAMNKLGEVEIFIYKFYQRQCAFI